ncbi:GntR family transcriptional regulator [Pseudomonas sp. App30]|uniref:GntR family transcriptional regulator n=1 Tax=Pseudomonas sp. App30 TaxID=3068990 RepID=UPI003A800A84
MTSQKQHLLVALEVRQLILRGDLVPGQRITEAALADLLKTSRTPVRQALPTLAQEGYLVAVGKRGYAVKSFTTEEAIAALDLRATLEGVAARQCASQGLSTAQFSALRACLAKGDALLKEDVTIDELKQAYGEMNHQFHALLLQSAENPLLNDLVARCCAVPFVAPNMVTFQSTSIEFIKQDLDYAHRQHHAIVDAISRGEETRVEMLLREHAATQRHSMNV